MYEICGNIKTRYADPHFPLRPVSVSCDNAGRSQPFTAAHAADGTWLGECRPVAGDEGQTLRPIQKGYGERVAGKP